MKIFCMSDIHGHSGAFEAALALVDLSAPDTMLILLGDYVHGPRDFVVLDRILELQEQYGSDKVIALMGNHEEMVLDGSWSMEGEGKYPLSRYLDWMGELPRYYTTDHQIFCHAGVDEEAGEFWKWSTDDHTYLWKNPATFGQFYMTVIAGHIGTRTIAGDRSFHDIYYDGASHYFIDGSAHVSGVIPVLMVDTQRDKYYRITETGLWPILPYEG